MPRSKRPDPDLPPGPARDLVDLFSRLRYSSELRIGQIARRTGYAPAHISEVIRGWKAPSPDAAARIAQVLGADDNTVRRARRRAEDLKEWKRSNSWNRQQIAADHPGHQELETELARAIAHFSAVDGRQGLSVRLLSALGIAEEDNAKLPIHHQLSSPDVLLHIIEGDLFDQQTHLAVGFSDTFDTSTEENRVIHDSSVQGQLLRRVYHGDQDWLDGQLTAALTHVVPVSVESQRDKPHGKQVRYPLGTVAVLGEPRRLIFVVAYSRMGNDLVARAPVEELWSCFTELWEAVYRHGQRGALSVPLMGSGLARVDSLDRGNLLRLILLSFVSYSRLRLICNEMNIVISPGDTHRVDLTGLRDFLKTL
jgi:plasmid maintenance system antidote protein VapI